MKLAITTAPFAIFATSHAFVHPSGITNVGTGNGRVDKTPTNLVRRKNSFIKRVQTNLRSAPTGSSQTHPQDLASTTPQLLASLWEQIAKGCKLSKGESITVMYPKMKDKFDASYLERLTGHLDVCKDVCDDFGINTILTPVQEKINGRNTVVGFAVKSFKDPNRVGTLASDGNFNFAPDPFFDDDDWDVLDAQIRAAVKEDEAEDENDIVEMEDLPEIKDKIPTDDEKIIDISKKWVNKIMSDMGICPFTKGADFAGLPMGKVFYITDRSTSVEDMYAKYWAEVVRVEQSPEKELSTTLLITPEFLIDNVELFENFSNSLTQPLESLGVEVSF